MQPTADQAWPPSAVDLHIAAARRKDRLVLLATFTLQTTMRILPLLLVLSCAAWQATALAQADGEPRSVPTRGLLKRGLLAKGKPTTTTTPPPQEEVEYEDDAEYPEGEGQEPSTEAPTSSTEGKKLVAGGVRPFRSNTDLLEALKRRRAQAAEAKLHGHASAASAPAHDTVPTEAPVKASFNKKRFNNAAKESNGEDAAAPAPAPAKPGRGRFGRPASKSVQESEPEEQNESAPSARTSRTFSRRGGN